MHDALIKPLPGNNMAPCLAESWQESPDGLVVEFKLREGLKFHNGDPFTAEDVKFSFHRYRGTSARQLHERVKAVEVVDPHRVRFVLHAPWPDFLAFYATPATGAAWLVPRKAIDQGGVVARIPGAVESEIPVARSPCAAGGQPGRGQARHQRRGATRLLAPDRIDHPERHGVRAADRPVPARSRPRQASPHRRRLPQRL